MPRRTPKQVFHDDQKAAAHLDEASQLDRLAAKWGAMQPPGVVDSPEAREADYSSMLADHHRRTARKLERGSWCDRLYKIGRAVAGWLVR